jgi:transcriptional regulator with XRE-family HTH domain
MLFGNYAERIRFVRSLTNLSREAFQSKYGINKNTMKSWELGINSLTEKSAHQISEAIKNEGFCCSPEWLIFGLGSEPRSISSDETILNEISEQSKVIYEAEYFKKNNSNSEVVMITDLSMSPNYTVGDYVGSTLEKNIDHPDKLTKFIGKICIVHLLKEIIIVRKIIKGPNNHTLLCPINTEYDAEIITYNDIQSIGRVVWYRTTN